MSNVHEATKEILYYIPAKIIPALVNVLAVTIYTRLLLPEEYGCYVLTLTSISLVSATIFTWISSAAIRFWVKEKAEGNLKQLFTNLLVGLSLLYALSALVSYGALLLLENHLYPKLVVLLKIGILVLGINVSYTLVISILRAERQTIKFALYSSVYAIGVVVLAVVGVVQLHAGPAGILWGTVISGGIIFLVETRTLIRKIGLDLSLISWGKIVEYAAYGIPLIGVGFGAMVLSESDRYFIAYFGNTADAGIYGAVYNIANNTIGLIFGVFLPATLPVAIQVYEKEGERKVAELLSYIMSLYLIFMLPAVAGISVLSRNILGVLLPQEFLGAAPIVPWVATGVLCYGATSLVLYPFLLKKYTMPLLVFILAAGCLNIVINMFLIPRLGILGAGISTFCAYAVYLSLTWIFSARLMPVPFPWSCFWKTTISATVMAAILSFWQNESPGICGLSIRIVAGALVYFLCLTALREHVVTRILKSGFRVIIPLREGT